MNNLYIAPTPSSPEIDLRFDMRHFIIKGEAYPENAALFWGDVISNIRRFSEEDSLPEKITVDVILTYFNSSSTKMLFSLFDTLNEKAASGTPVVLNWYHDEEDDTIYEFGQELCEDFPNLTFHDRTLQD
ncbi:MAG: DUF1987 domain-containing protein [Pusillimonas sp.]|jgi:hypothetical protein|nr:DUF1987 domain-containing protein [Pusillimonas sp.]